MTLCGRVTFGGMRTNVNWDRDNIFYLFIYLLVKWKLAKFFFFFFFLTYNVVIE